MSIKSDGPDGTVNTSQKLEHETGPGMALADMALLAILIANLILVPMALFAMGEESGPAASLKYLLVGFAAAGAAFGVNKFAVDRLAPLHAVGFKLAGVLAVVGILVTGSGTALGSFTGIVFGSVETKIYQDAGQDLTGFIGDVNEAALVAERIGPSVQSVADNIAQTSDCESQSSCLSGHGNGGRGPVSRALDTAAAQAFSIAQTMQTGQQDRAQRLEALNRLNAKYHEVLADGGKSAAEQRAELQALHSEVRQVAAALMEAMPIAVLQGYVRDLQAGASISGNPSGSRILSTYLRGHGDALAEQLDGLPETNLVAPTFPDRPGMIEVLKYVPTFLAIAAIVIVGELVLPITLYLMTYLGISWELEKLRGDQKTKAKASIISRLVKRPDDADLDGSSS